jgi:radical SAM superfamily enzyme YgiQ (UPF0313 family)
MDDDDPSVFARTVDWAVGQGIETATFHILTPYPGTALYARMAAQGRLTTNDWDRYDTRHAVFQPARMSASALEAGYWWAYREFYRWGSIARGAAAHGDGRTAPRRLCGRVEEVRAAVGPGDPRQAYPGDAAGARIGPERVWTARHG